MSQPLEFTPESTSRAVDAVQAAVGAGDYARAARLADGAINNGLVHPAFFNAKALLLERTGRDDEALALFQQARTFTPKNAQLLNAIGLCLTRLSRFDEALETFDEALRLSPAYAPTHHRKGLALGLAGRMKEAEAAHRRAAQLDPGFAEALASVATIAARKGDEKTARNQAERALRIDPANATAHAALAMLENAAGEFTAAESRMRPIASSPQLAGHPRAVALALLADALDGQGKAADAFAAYGAANAEHEKIHAAQFAGRDRASAVVDRTIGYLSAMPPESWRRAEPDTTAVVRSHVFLIGFPRSGTTLLEQVLESHGDVVTLEERDCLFALAEQYLTSSGGMARLADLAGATLGAARQSYWQGVGRLGLHPAGKVFVDKHPLNTIKLPLIFKLFPDAKILFAIRDPRDVVFSCFRRQLDIDLPKYELLSLEGCVRLYDRVMTLGEISRERLALSWFDLRYEDLVADFEGRMRDACQFLGIEWRDSMKDFAATAHRLDPRQASAEQVRRGLYTEGVGQWRRYERELADVLPALQPWIKRFGYA